MLRGVNDFEDDLYPPRRSGAARVVVMLVVAIALVFVAWVAEKRFRLVEWAEAEMTHGSVALPADPRLASFLDEGERDFVTGDLDGAQSALDKASVLSGPDARVSLDLARVASARADIPWLKLRMLSPDAADEIRITKATLTEEATIAVRAAQDAVTAHPDDTQALAAKIDALRLAGEIDAARGYVVAVFGKAADPETAYVLAALEMAQGAPAWPAVIERLRIAASGEGSSGRVHAALVYALVNVGDLAGAKAEMAKLDSLARPYPCLGNLRALLGRAAQPVSTDQHDAGAAADAAAEGGRAPKGAAMGAQASNDESGDTTPAGPLVSANQAMAVHDYSRAEQLYQAILASQPGDSQALSGLGDIAHARGDTQGAISAYRRAVATNPSYLPALLGLADTQWFGGEKAAAVSGYKNIADHFPEGTYPEYVRSRAGGAQ